MAVEPFEAMLARARRDGCTYLIIPEIVHWEDRATFWTGIPDRLQIRIAIEDVSRGSRIDTTDIFAKSLWGGDHPEDLLRHPVEGYVDELMGERLR